MEAGKTLTNEEVVRELLELLKKNAMKEQANDVFEICSYVDGLEKKIDSMTEELTSMQNQIKEMQEDGIDSSKDAGKLMISVLSAVAEIERENIRTQTMAGREQKDRKSTRLNSSHRLESRMPSSA